MEQGNKKNYTPGEVCSSSEISPRPPWAKKLYGKTMGEGKGVPHLLRL